MGVEWRSGAAYDAVENADERRGGAVDFTAPHSVDADYARLSSASERSTRRNGLRCATCRWLKNANLRIPIVAARAAARARRSA